MKEGVGGEGCRKRGNLRAGFGTCLLYFSSRCPRGGHAAVPVLLKCWFQLVCPWDGDVARTSLLRFSPAQPCNLCVGSDAIFIHSIIKPFLFGDVLPCAEPDAADLFVQDESGEPGDRRPVPRHHTGVGGGVSSTAGEVFARCFVVSLRLFRWLVLAVLLLWCCCVYIFSLQLPFCCACSCRCCWLFVSQQSCCFAAVTDGAMTITPFYSHPQETLRFPCFLPSFSYVNAMDTVHCTPAALRPASITTAVECLTLPPSTFVLCFVFCFFPFPSLPFPSAARVSALRRHVPRAESGGAAILRAVPVRQGSR